VNKGHPRLITLGDRRKKLDAKPEFENPAEWSMTMAQHDKALPFTLAIIGTAAAALLTISMILLAAPRVEATPEISGGKPCDACHTSMPPTKENVKK